MSGRGIPRLHLVTDDAVLRRPDFIPLAAELLAAGGERLALHVRGPGCGGEEVFDLAGRLAPLALEVGARLLVNDRVDVAAVLGLDGAHLGQRSLPPSVVRELLGPDALVGVSTHSDDEEEEAVAAGADYLFVGAIYATASHRGRPGRGPGALAGAGKAGIPAIAIGGIDAALVADVLAAGADGVAVIGGVWHAPHPRDALIRYLDALEHGRGAS